MIKTISLIAVILTYPVTAMLKADPSPTPTSKTNKKQSTASTSKATSSKTSQTSPASSGWSLVNGVWAHSDGYQWINGRVIRTSVRAHKPAPKPPTPAEIAAATKKKNAPRTPAEIAAEKAAQRQRNLTPRAASQTGSHL